jgi:hypothetical protein
VSFIACAVVLRRSAVLGVGGFSERFGIGGEEELLGWDLARALGGLGWGLRERRVNPAHVEAMRRRLEQP